MVDRFKSSVLPWLPLLTFVVTLLLVGPGCSPRGPWSGVSIECGYVPPAEGERTC